jgi:L-asparaginase/Glu-tRNA(Gln) amidotransferase subunit D
MTPGQAAALRRARGRGVHVVISSRTGGGRVPVRRGEDPTEATSAEGGILGAGDLNPQKARILLMLALTRTHDPSEITTIFHRQ